MNNLDKIYFKKVSSFVWIGTQCKSDQKSDGGYIAMNAGTRIPISRIKKNEIIGLTKKNTPVETFGN